MRVGFAPQAISDIAQIADYIREHNPSAASDLELAIQRTIDLLREFPMLGRSRLELDVRALGIPRYPFTIYYRVEEEMIWIAHIRDDRRRQPEADEL